MAFVPGISLLKGFGLGVMMALLAAWLPAREAANIAPRSALNRSSLERRTIEVAPYLAIIGLLVMGSGGLLLLLPGLWVGFAGLFVIVAGGAMLTPGLMIVMVSLLLRLFGRFQGLLWRMALRDVTRHLSRTGVAAAALMIALASAISVGVMVDSFRQTFSFWLEDTLSADIYTAPVSRMSNDVSAVLRPEVIQKLRSVPEVGGINTYRGFNVTVNERQTRLSVVELSTRAKQGYQLLDAVPLVWEKFATGAVLITESLAYRHDLKVGDAVQLTTTTGPREFNIVAIYKDFGAEHGRILMQRAIYQRFWQSSSVSTASIYLKDGLSVQQLMPKLEAELGAIQALRFTDQRSLKDLSLVIFERTFTITTVLQFLVVGVAFVGLVSALLALNLERIQIFAVLRAQGMLGREVGLMMVLNSLAIGLMAGLLALPMGILLSILLIDVINRRAFGWSMTIHIDPGLLLQTIILALLAALLACALPVRRLIFERPVESLQQSFM
ncbi:MAG: FtsX-like permease family protein [Pseudomonadota bacterium]